MNIDLSLIKPSPKPIRTTWNEDKLDELAQSIEEQGLIVPIKVRPADEDAEIGYDEDIFYEIVYGHRRLEAMRIAGFTETDAVVEGLDDDTALLQQIIENELREDLDPIDKADGYARGVASCGSMQALHRETGIPVNTIKYYLDLKKLPGELQAKIDKPTGRGDVPEGKITPSHVQHSAVVQPLYREKVLEKAAEEGLSVNQTRKVAESVAATKDPRRKQSLIDTPFSSFIHDPEMNRRRAEQFGEADPLDRKVTEPSDAMWEMTLEVKMLLDYLKASRKMASEALIMDKEGKFAPEARGFVARKATLMVEAWQEVVDKLEG